MSPLPPSPQTYQLMRARASTLMGATEAWVWLCVGKLFDTPGWSGRYLGDIARTDEGIAVILNLLDQLEAGETIPVQLMWEGEPVKGYVLQLVNGRLYEVRNGRRKRVRRP